MNLRLTILGLLFCLTTILRATHNRAGEITYVQIDDLTIRVLITIYTDAESTVNRQELEIKWGDGTTSMVNRFNTAPDGLGGTLYRNDTRINLYEATHTYPGRGRYTISLEDRNRNGGVLNMSDSDTNPFYIETTLTLLSPQFTGTNSSAVLLQPPLDFACVGQTYIHNPNAFDAEGDSLAYEWTIPKRNDTTDVKDYVFPDEILPGSNNQISLDPVTGNIVWTAPQLAGEYNIAFKIKEYREGVLLNTIIRDMQIIVMGDCENTPPQLIIDDQFCVVANDSLLFNVRAIDNDQPQQRVRVSAIGAPLDFENSPAIFNVSENFEIPPVDVNFFWKPTCLQIRERPYQIVFKAEDNYFRSPQSQSTTGLVDLRNVDILVVGPEPENLVVETMQNQNQLSWDSPYSCDEDDSPYFQGFTVWRKRNSDGVQVGFCTTDLSTQGYEIIDFIPDPDANGNRFEYTDLIDNSDDIFCYRITARFARTTPSGQLFNAVESRPSNFSCSNFRTDIPIITQVSVENTGESNGRIELEWIPPFDNEFDTTVFTGPYRFDIIRDNLQVISSEEYASYSAIPKRNVVDDASINTLDDQFTYSIDMFSNQVYVDKSVNAQSLRLFTESVASGVRLSWQAIVPWNQDYYEIYKLNNEGAFTLVNTTEQNTWIDINVAQEVNYCYFVRSFGSFSFFDFDQTINNSQEACINYIYTEPPCPPTVSIEANCNFSSPQAIQEDFAVELEWAMLDCPNNKNLDGFNVYFTARGSEDRIRLNNELITAEMSFSHQSRHGIEGCYEVEGVGLDGSVGSPSEAKCFYASDDCTNIELPNTFTPNGDGKNDIFKPISYNFGENFHIEIFNRWGNKVFETDDIEINWDGSDLNGNELDKGVYFYKYNLVFQLQEGGNVLKEGNGYIELLK